MSTPAITRSIQLDIDITHRVELMKFERESKKTKDTGIMRIWTPFRASNTRMVGIEAKVVCTKKTIRCCTASFRGHG